MSPFASGGDLDDLRGWRPSRRRRSRAGRGRVVEPLRLGGVLVPLDGLFPPLRSRVADAIAVRILGDAAYVLHRLADAARLLPRSSRVADAVAVRILGDAPYVLFSARPRRDFSACSAAVAPPVLSLLARGNQRSSPPPGKPPRRAVTPGREPPRPCASPHVWPHVRTTTCLRPWLDRGELLVQPFLLVDVHGGEHTATPTLNCLAPLAACSRRDVPLSLNGIRVTSSSPCAFGEPVAQPPFSHVGITWRSPSLRVSSCCGPDCFSGL